MVETKVENGEALTDEENKVLMGAPVETDEEEKKDLDDLTGVKKPEIKDKKDDSKTAEEIKAEEDAEKEKEAKPDEAKDKKAELEDKDKDIVSEVEKSLEKSDGQIELSKYTDKEKALFWEYRRAKKRAQTAESERDSYKIREAAREELAKAQKEAKEEDKDEEGDDEYLTKKEAKALLKEVKDTITTKTDADSKQDKYSRWFEKGKELFDDFEEVIEASKGLLPIILKRDPEKGKELQVAYEKKTDNVALIVYDIIKQDPKFGKLFPDTAKTEEEKEAEKVKKEAEDTKKRIKENEKKTKTSGNKGAGGGGKIGEYTIEEVANMSLEELAKVPQATREKFLMEL